MTEKEIWMLARVITYDGNPERVDEGVRHFKAETLPLLQPLAGFGGGYVLVDYKSGRMIEITFWNGESRIEASDDIARTLATESAEVIFATALPVIEVYEVAHQP